MTIKEILKRCGAIITGAATTATLHSYYQNLSDKKLQEELENTRRESFEQLKIINEMKIKDVTTKAQMETCKAKMEHCEDKLSTLIEKIKNIQIFQ